MNNTSQNNVIEIKKLSRDFDGNLALNNVDLSIPKGLVFGLVGKNGAGKTTLIKHVMGLLDAQSGSVAIFSNNPVSSPVETLSRIGYMGESNELPGWMRVSELINYRKAFCPTWDDTYVEDLISSFEIDVDKKAKEMSKGQAARVSLMLALAHKPDLLVLDEPSDGLDPLVRRDILRAVIRSVVNEGRTVLFSSHLLDEVERISDRVAMIEEGEIIYEDDITNIQESFHQVDIVFDKELNDPPQIENCTQWQGSGKIWTVSYHGNLDALGRQLEKINGSIQQTFPLNLTDAFISMVSGEKSTLEKNS